MFLYAVRYQSWFLPKIRCKCLRFFVAKIQKPMEKPILLVAFDMLGRFFSIIIIFLKTHFLRKIEDAIIGHYIPARDIVLPSNYRFGKRRQKNLPDLIPLSQFFSNARIKLKIPEEGDYRDFSIIYLLLSAKS